MSDPASTPAPNPATYEELLSRAKGLHDQIRSWRREIHRYPELTFTENRTAGLVNSVLTDLGIPTETEVAKTGVVGTIAGASGPVVGLRADMDALPITETNGYEFDSTRPGIMHACGHDAHTAMLMGAATILQGLASEGRLPGTVKLLFQPSEEAQDAEGKSGGKRMVEEGALNGVDAVFGLHVDSESLVGKVGTCVGPLAASADKFTLVIEGSGGHAAAPHLTVDPIALSGLVINAVHQVVSRRLNPVDPGVITIATINGGTVSNVIPDRVEMTGTIRAFSPEARQLLQDELGKAARIVEPLGGKAHLTIFPGYPPTVNDAEAAESMFEGLRATFGDDNVFVAEKGLGAEDFSYMAEVSKGSYMQLGVRSPEWDREYPVHRADFRLDEDALPIGSASLAAAAIRWMEKNAA